MVAAGTSPNVIYEKEHPGTFKLDKYGQFFQSFATSDDGVDRSGRQHGDGFFTSYQRGTRRITFYGDNHPRYAGNVVKAMASAKDGYPFVTKLFAPSDALDRRRAQTVRESQWTRALCTLDDGLLAGVHQVNRLTPTIVEVVIRAPFASRHFDPGQFFRLQNFEANAPVVDGTSLAMEGSRSPARGPIRSGACSR